MLFGWLLLTFGMPRRRDLLRHGLSGHNRAVHPVQRSETTLAAKGLLHTGK
jgi:hypothetical protein